MVKDAIKRKKEVNSENSAQELLVMGKMRTGWESEETAE